MSELIELGNSFLKLTQDFRNRKKSLRVLARVLIIEITENLNLIGNVKLDISSTAEDAARTARDRAIRWLIANLSNDAMLAFLIAEDDRMGDLELDVGDSDMNYEGKSLSESLIFCAVKIKELRLISSSVDHGPNKTTDFIKRIGNLRDELLRAKICLVSLKLNKRRGLPGFLRLR